MFLRRTCVQTRNESLYLYCFLRIFDFLCFQLLVLKLKGRLKSNYYDSFKKKDLKDGYDINAHIQFLLFAVEPPITALPNLIIIQING